MIEVCCGCDRLFDCDPVRVPRLRGEPVCAECLEVINVDAARSGLPPIVAEDGAYGVP